MKRFPSRKPVKVKSRKPSLTVTARRVHGKVVDLAVSGHAGFAPKGRDIVCAATSALVFSAAHGARAHARAQVRVMDEPEGDYRLVVPGGGNARTQAILQTALAGLRAIARSYPGTLRVRTLAGKASAPPKRSAPPRRSEKN